MKLNFLQLRTIISLGIPVVYLILTVILDGFKPADVVIALLAGFISFLLMTLFTSKDSRNVNQHIGLSTEEKEGDEIIIETEACHYENGVYSLGRLILTTDHLSFRGLDHEYVQLSLKDISAVRVYHFEHLFKKGFSLIVKTKEFIFEVEYVRDWMDIIRYQMANFEPAEMTLKNDGIVDNPILDRKNTEIA
ncbi:GRAM domain-containing protein [Fulvivirga sedimenti]|uniref:GRAM domain-containing protein n=1 Tax=Fulvivirga sedimenti TaxID=2879465 RepID=A0A9X1KWU5_9BACT|nr:GRAM domain-containing protein [Fulvivirga sedimenti]MCA6074314.1 GRAM domain-containing protein [Fulvivirga sedimenti]